MNISNLVLNNIEQLPLGEPFTTKHFLSFGPRTSIDQALSRLVRKGKITRLASGIFVRPQENSYVGKVMPEPNKIVEAYAQSIGATVQVHGAQAAKLFGLSTQAPTQIVYYSSGPSKKFKIGKLISPFWLTKYRILNAFEFDQKVKQPSESVNPDNHPSDKLGRIVD